MLKRLLKLKYNLKVNALDVTEDKIDEHDADIKSITKKLEKFETEELKENLSRQISVEKSKTGS